MAPFHPRQLFLLSIPTLAALLGYFWYKKRRIGIGSDPGDKSNVGIDEISNPGSSRSTPVKITDDPKKHDSPGSDKSFSRSLSGVDSAPIDIILPKEHRAKVAPVISDEDLDLEIEKIKSMKNSSAEPFKLKPSASVTTTDSMKEKMPTPSPKNSLNLISSPSKPLGDSNMNKNKNNNNKDMEMEMEEVSVEKRVIATETKLCELKIESNNNLSNGNVKEKGKKKKKQQQQQQQEKVEEKQSKSIVVLEQEHELRQSSERDSANHSPSDVMLASPSLSSISDNHSEGSNDSGKGGSEVATPPSRTPAGDGSVVDEAAVPMIYEFVIPQNLVGKLIGVNGRFVTEIYNKTHAHILVKKHPTNNKLKVCAVEGTQTEINNALKMVREKFPLKKFSELTLEQVSIINVPPTISLIPDHLYLKLVEGVNNDTIVSCMVAPNHLFLQQPTHPTYPNLNVLKACMTMCYSNTDSPLLPSPIPENTICVAQSVGEWLRAMILSTDVEANTSYVKFLDYGGYAFLDHSNLRQIRGDFMLLPFQAAECFLANIRPVGGDGTAWSQEAYNAVAELTSGAIICTQIAEYTFDGIPLVLMYIIEGPSTVVNLNEELVNRGYAEWVTEEVVADCEGAVGGVVAATA